MKIIYVKINGITCDHCRMKITKALLQNKNIKSIKFDGNIAEIKYDKYINKEEIVKSINDIDYYTNLNMISENKKQLKKLSILFEMFFIMAIILLVTLILNNIFGLNVFNAIPTINSNIALIALFTTGLLTSIHCISMCGAINLIASTSQKKDYKRPILYNLGRLLSYTLIGGFVGLIGSVLKVNIYIQTIILILAAIFMLLMGLNMIGFINFNLRFKTPKIFSNLNPKSSFVIGLLNGFMPCGPLQAMQLYALSTGSFFYGALSMFLFCLGTIPLVLGFGLIFTKLKSKGKAFIQKISSVLIILLSLFMVNRALTLVGINITGSIKTAFQKDIYKGYTIAEIKDGYQYVEIELTPNGYTPIVVKKDIPVIFNIKVRHIENYGCTNSVKIPELGITKDLNNGDNYIEFTPKKIGDITYTCWMGMVRSNIKVINDLSEIKELN